MATAERSGAEFSDFEKAAMKERAAELRAEKASSRGKAKKDPEAELLEKIASLPEADRGLATAVHRIISAAAPELTPRTWYGMPAYAKNGKVLCFLQPAQKFDSRYATLGFSDTAALDDGEIWPTSFAINSITPGVEAEITRLVKRAAE